MYHRRRDRRDRHSNHFQRVHEHSTRGAERPAAENCACGGNGWILSSCDVWERCSRHYSGQEHPEHRISPGRKEEKHELYLEICREKRIDDPQEAHAKALKEKRRRESDGPFPLDALDTEKSGSDDPSDLPF